MKYLVVTGGVVSGLGKGVTISSMGRLLQACGLTVTAIKIDPYLNVDAGTMSPFEHGEVFVLEDGGESDLDLGNYERFLGITLTSDHNITTGKIYRKVILKERKGDYLGKTVQVVPHITNEIQEWIERVAHIPTDVTKSKVADVCLIEVGGTVGDIESSVFLEALRQFQFRVGHGNFCLCFVSLVPVLSDEQKTKPTQHGVKDLRSLGLSPQVIFCRSTQPLQEATRNKISSFCHVPPLHVLSVHDVSNVYQVPLMLQEQGLHSIIRNALLFQENGSSSNNGQQQHHPFHDPQLAEWAVMANAVSNFTKTVKIALIGKYTGLQDSYLSVIKALKHAAIACEHSLDLLWIEASHLEDPSNDDQYQQAHAKLQAAQGVVVPGGFGDRGFLGKILAVQYCRLQEKPILGICLGFQAMVVEYCRNCLDWPKAHSTEFDEKSPHPVVMFMPEIDPETMGGTMRLGARVTKFVKSTGGVAQTLYGNVTEISERHRHRYEVNPELVPDMERKGDFVFTGRDETATRMEIAELLDHPYFVGTQFHPEFKSRPLHPSPPFHGLLLASCGMLQDYLAASKATS